jgi:hypothetical protein
MGSVPLRGNGWVPTSRDMHRLPSRYREVVLTGSIEHLNLGDNGRIPAETKIGRQSGGLLIDSH